MFISAKKNGEKIGFSSASKQIFIALTQAQTLYPTLKNSEDTIQVFFQVQLGHIIFLLQDYALCGVDRRIKLACPTNECYILEMRLFCVVKILFLRI